MLQTIVWSPLSTFVRVYLNNCSTRFLHFLIIVPHPSLPTHLLYLLDLSRIELLNEIPGWDDETILKTLSFFVCRISGTYRSFYWYKRWNEIILLVYRVARHSVSYSREHDIEEYEVIDFVSRPFPARQCSVIQGCWRAT